ncbi:MAG TPA: MBL fold metallo-hydrolase [Chthonomonadales bacterium]|nr:MBL fold metallo-hydrolase [Chthonomonadales bacterium]
MSGPLAPDAAGWHCSEGIRLRPMDVPRIVLFSTPLVSTWVFDETHRVLFDAGDGVSALMESRIHKIRLAALTHTHRDHCSGLMQLLNLRGGAGDFTTVFPEDSGSARALLSFLSGFDTRSTSKVRFQPLGVGASLPIEPDRHCLRGFATDHYPQSGPPRTLSLGYQIVRQVDRVRPEYRHLPQPELDTLRLAHGRAHITRTEEDVLLSITGDTMPLPAERFVGSRVLLHECTFLNVEEKRESALMGHPHSDLDDVLATARDARVGHLGLYHISRRYEDGHALATVRERCATLRVPCPVSVALPGRLYEDLLSHRVWPGD